MSPSSPPRLSIVWYGRNCARSIVQTIDSFLAVSGVELEVVMQDGDSTDGTVEVLRDHAARDPRIKAQGGSQSSYHLLLAGLRRAQGELVAVFTEDDQARPEHLRAAITHMQDEAAALLCGTDGPLDIVTMLFSPYRPSIRNALFRRSSLVRLGLEQEGWHIDCLDFDLWKRIATDETWQYFPETINSSTHSNAHFFTSKAEVENHLQDCLRLSDELFADHGFMVGLADGHQLKLECVATQFSAASARCAALEQAQVVRIFSPWWRRLATEMGYLAQAQSSYARNSHARLADFRQRPPPSQDADGPALGRFLRGLGIHLRSLTPLSDIERTLAAPFKSTEALPLGDVRRHLADIYAVIAAVYEDRGQVQSALTMWGHAELLWDIWVDGLALQTLGKTPYVSPTDVALTHKHWVDRHVAQTSHVEMPLMRPYRGDRKIRIAYHCSFMDSDTIRYIWTKVMASHDRNKFEVFGYAPAALPEDIAAGFDVVRDIRAPSSDPTAVRALHMSMLSDDRFMNMVRSDQIDVLIELSGYSPGHRFVAMSRRCAPIQVMHMNHPFTSGVPNVDYFVTDHIASPAEDDDYYTENLVHLPRRLFCYDYRGSANPEIVDPPCLSRGYVTFGCFGGGQKFNSTLLELWARVLHRVPNSRLRLQNGHMKKADARRLITSRFKRLGIAPERINIVPGVDRNSLLLSYREVDISLDTWPYSGGLTIAESLWQGVPVIGFHFNDWRSRYGASLLKEAGCWDLVAQNFDEFVEIAAALAADSARLKSLRHKLQGMCVEHGLADSTGMARTLEAAYQGMVDRLVAKNAPMP